MFFSTCTIRKHFKNRHLIYCVVQVSVSPGAGYVSLLVVRAQGIVGDVSVEWRTVDGSARSAGKLQPDFLVSHHRYLTHSHLVFV